MSLYDELWVNDFECPRCGLNNEKIDIQFKPCLGEYEPDVNKYQLGDIIPSFPNIALYETDGVAQCSHCKEFIAPIGVRIERRRIVLYWLFNSDVEEWASLPQPYSAKKASRKRAARKERSERNCLAAYGTREPTIYQLIGGSVAATFKYESFARMIFRQRPVRQIGRYVQYEKGKWEKLPESRV